MAKPETLAVVNQDLDRRSASIAENKDRAGKMQKELKQWLVSVVKSYNGEDY